MGGTPKPKMRIGKQQNAAPDSGHSDQGSDSKTHQALDQQIHDSNSFSLSSFSGVHARAV